MPLMCITTIQFRVKNCDLFQILWILVEDYFDKLNMHNLVKRSDLR